jgi:GTP pyrophosphokinase
MPEGKEITGLYQGLLRSCSHFYSRREVGRIREAYDLLIELSELRNNPHATHDIAASVHLAQLCVNEIGLGSTSVICSLLFKAIQTAEYSPDLISKQFGQDLLQILLGLKRVSALHTYSISLQHEQFLHLVVRMSENVHVLFIMLAVRLHNLRFPDTIPVDEREKLYKEAYFLYTPIAHRLGLYRIKSELEDLSMRYLYPEVYADILAKINDSQHQQQAFIQQFADSLRHELRSQGFDFEIKGRSKSIHSIWKKMLKQKVELDEIYDLFAVRIILNSDGEREKSDCWKVYGIVTDKYLPSPSRMRDWISAPRASGYESLHATVQAQEGRWVEVQIRTQRMDIIAEKGNAAHWRYKEAGKTARPEEWLNRVRQALENPEMNADHLSVLNQGIAFSDMYVFTPGGDLKQLPVGATVIDFAYAIHSDVGHKCTGAKVNGKNVPIKHVLNNGDKVEVKLSKNQVPKIDWLSFAVSKRAKHQIKRALRDMQFLDAEKGKEILHRKLGQWNISLHDELIHRMLFNFKIKTLLELYQKIGEGTIEVSLLKTFFDSAKAGLKPAEHKKTESDGKPMAKLSAGEQELEISGSKIGGLSYTLAACCSPVAGDHVFGFITVKEGVKIHRYTCPNACEMINRYPYRIMKIKWKGVTQVHDTLKIRVSAADEPGILNSISSLLSREMWLNMRSLNAGASDGVFEAQIELAFPQSKDKKKLISSIKKIKGVIGAEILP